MKKLFLILLSCFFFFSALCQPSGGRVNPTDISAHKEIVGNFAQQKFYTQRYSGTPLSVLTIVGKHYLFPPKGYTFGEDIHLRKFQEGIPLRKVDNHYEFTITKKNKTYNDEYLMQVETDETGDPYDLLFIIYRQYNPHVQHPLPESDISYRTIDDKVFLLNDSTKNFSVVYFPSFLSTIKSSLVQSFNRLANEFSTVQFIVLSTESLEKTKDFKQKSQLNWHMQAETSGNSLFSINRMASDNSIYVINNKTQEIVFYYYISHKLPELLETALVKLVR